MTIATTEAPRYVHDCNCCAFLGHAFKSDLYFCPQDGYPTVIARHSDEGPDYTSGLVFSDHDPALAEAKRRAIAQGLL